MSRRLRRFVPKLTPSPYELLTYRVRQQILSPQAQVARQAVISRKRNDPDDAWEQLLSEIAEEDFVTITKRDDGAVLLCWKKAFD